VVRTATATRGAIRRVEVSLPPLHSGGQREVAEHPARFKVLSAGRRWGKTKLASVIAVGEALQGKLVWWVAPSFPMSSIGWREIVFLSNQIPGHYIHHSDRLVGFSQTKGWVQVKSADDPYVLRGEGLDLVVMDECSLIDSVAWFESLRPALADRKGRALFISTPKGKNWFYELFVRGQDELQSEYKSWEFPTWTNPYIDPEEVENARRTMPKDAFDQEIGAQFLNDVAGVFRNLDRLVRGELRGPEEKRDYVIGWDPAKQTDFSVMVVMDSETREVVGFERTNQVDYTVQLRQLHELSARYNHASVLMDSTGPGDPILEMAKAKGIPIEGFHFTSTSKQQLIESLVASIDHEELSFPNIPMLIHELKMFQYTITRAGNLKYSAPKGYHDDCVVGLALANWASRHRFTWVL